MEKRLVDISKTISYALRHNPAKFGLKLDKQGYVFTNDLITGINAATDISITVDDIRRIIAESEKNRFELADCETRIRATYGHSVKDKMISLNVSTPPAVLYHGTTHQVVGKILKEGLKPMNRQYVHLSDDNATAVTVGKRRDRNPVILTIDAKAMLAEGFEFGTGNDHTWLVASVPPKFIVSHKEN